MTYKITKIIPEPVGVVDMCILNSLGSSSNFILMRFLDINPLKLYPSISKPNIRKN